jgi:UDP-N-acetylmuramoyl-tripeptide--D-alanyl-D-alanine ligase
MGSGKSIQQVAAALGIGTDQDGLITGYSVDTRTLVPGDLFFALRGESFDGNNYIEQALAKGAAAVVAERPVAGPVLVVPDSLQALQRLAVWARDRWAGDVVGVTGSAGKTSTKDVIASLLAVKFRVGKTAGNFNNHVGLPLSILRLPADAQVAVLELGMNHAGEIRDLARIARPRIGVVTNVGYAHIEFFESIEGIAAAKRELVEALPPDGIAVLNADDPLVAQFTAAKTITYGLNPGADVRAEEVQFQRDRTKFRVGGVAFETQLLGRHNVRNILAAIAVAGEYGLTPADLQESVIELQPGAMRGERTCYHNIYLLNDCYNSNPDAAKSMVDVLRDTPAARRIAVLGEMRELGRWSGILHREVGRYVAGSGIDVLVGIRGAAKEMVDAAIDAGLPGTAAFFFEDPADAGKCLRKIAREGDAILFKGSRGTHVEIAMQTFQTGEMDASPAGQAHS